MIHTSNIDPRGRPTVTAGSGHCFRTCRPYVRTSVPTFQNLVKQSKFQAKTMFTTGETVCLAEWIVDDPYAPNIQHYISIQKFFMKLYHMTSHILLINIYDRIIYIMS